MSKSNPGLIEIVVKWSQDFPNLRGPPVGLKGQNPATLSYFLLRKIY